MRRSARSTTAAAGAASLRTTRRCVRKASALIGGGSTWTGRVIAWSRSLKAAMAALRASAGCVPAAISMAANPRRRMVSIGSSGGPSARGPATGAVFAAQSIGETVVTGVPSAGAGGRGIGRIHRKLGKHFQGCPRTRRRRAA